MAHRLFRVRKQIGREILYWFSWVPSGHTLIALNKELRGLQMRKLITLVCAGGLTLGMGGAIAQDDEPQLELASKIVPVEIYACRYNDGQGPSDLDDAVDSWTAYMDENAVDSYAAWTLTKVYSGPDQDFDFLWLGAWTDGNAMGTGSDMLYSTGGEILENFGTVADCYVHANSASINYKLPDDGTVADGILVFSNCSIEDGARYSDIASATTEWASILTEAGSESAIYHWFPAFGGGGDDGPDYLSVRSYPNYAALGADYERQGNGGLFRTSGRLFGDIVDCDAPRVYDATSRRSAQLR
jgi:hypothetical protein